MHFVGSPGYRPYVILKERAPGSGGWDLDGPHCAWCSVLRTVLTDLLGLASERPSSTPKKVLKAL